jgi:DnaJ like chaperone protein
MISALRNFRSARSDEVSFRQRVEWYMTVTEGKHYLRLNALYIMWALVMADGVVTREEMALIEEARARFGVTLEEFEEVKSAFAQGEEVQKVLGEFQEYRRQESREERRNMHYREPKVEQMQEARERSALDLAYEELGLEEGCSLAVVKRRYRSLVLKYHPDRLQGGAASAEAIKEAEQRFRQVHDAFTLVRDSFPSA